MRNFFIEIQADYLGNFTVSGILRVIMETQPEIGFPHNDLDHMTFNDLFLKHDPSVHCVDGYAHRRSLRRTPYEKVILELIFQ